MAATLYITQSEFASLAAPPKALSGVVSSSDIDETIAAASAIVDSYLGGVYSLPLVSWGVDLKLACAAISLWLILGRRNYNASSPTDTYRLRYEDSIKWLREVRGGSVTPSGVVDADTSDDAARTRPYIVSNPPRGW